MVTDVPLDDASGRGTVETVWGMPEERPVPNTLISIPGAKDGANDAELDTLVRVGPVPNCVIANVMPPIAIDPLRGAAFVLATTT